MVITESCMFEFSVSKNMQKKGHNKGGGSREGSSTFVSNTNHQIIQNQWSIG